MGISSAVRPITTPQVKVTNNVFSRKQERSVALMEDIVANDTTRLANRLDNRLLLWQNMRTYMRCGLLSFT
jgi:hypothetical protein